MKREESKLLVKAVDFTVSVGLHTAKRVNVWQLTVHVPFFSLSQSFWQTDI